jgi:hypothetical protein
LTRRRPTYESCQVDVVHSARDLLLLPFLKIGIEEKTEINQTFFLSLVSPILEQAQKFKLEPHSYLPAATSTPLRKMEMGFRKKIFAKWKKMTT